MAFRPAAFMAWLIGVTVVVGLIGLPTLVMPGGAAKVPARLWINGVHWGFRRIIGVRARFVGLDRLPEGPVLLAAKHQAMWDTMMVFNVLPWPAVVLKRELFKVPLYGWWGLKLGMIGIDREGGASALKALIRDARSALAQNRSVVIFPEGSRSEPGSQLPYKPGVAALYRALDIPCVPVALNSGLCWPSRGYGFKPGTITLEVLEPIPPGLDRARFMAALQQRIETRSASLALDPPAG